MEMFCLNKAGRRVDFTMYSWQTLVWCRKCLKQEILHVGWTLSQSSCYLKDKIVQYVPMIGETTGALLYFLKQ